MDNLEDLWREFHSFLLLLHRFFLKLESMVALWEKILYLLALYFSFSEFSGTLRPPCTTMPWTIWPALVILWGVCWMFYGEHNQDWALKDGHFAADSAAGLYEESSLLDLSEGNMKPSLFVR
jgi:hypothetical protein